LLFFCNKAQGHFDYYSDGAKQEIRLQVINWQKIIKKHGPSVWKTAYRLLGDYTDAADCFQETFICALEVSRRQHVRNFSALLVRLATSRAIDRLRRRFSGQQVRIDAADLAAVPNTNPGPAQQAQAFCLRYLNDMSYRQVAKELGIKKSATGVLLHRARRKLRDSFEA
jgi:RNA polymerase sigma-70 factor (ECF subfamily)